MDKENITKAELLEFIKYSDTCPEVLDLDGDYRKVKSFSIENDKLIIKL